LALFDQLITVCVVITQLVLIMIHPC